MKEMRYWLRYTPNHAGVRRNCAIYLRNYTEARVEVPEDMRGLRRMMLSGVIYHRQQVAYFKRFGDDFCRRLCQQRPRLPQ